MTRWTPPNGLTAGTLVLACIATRGDAQYIQQRFESPLPTSDSQFGAGLAIQGDWAFAIDLTQRLVVYERGPDGWSISAVEDQVVGLPTFTALSVDGDWLAAGGLTTSAVPVVHFFELHQGSWVLRQTVPVPGAGTALHLRGDELVMGAPFFSGVELYAGRAYVLSRDPGSGLWAITARFEGPSPAFEEKLGTSVRYSDDGDEILVGAPNDGDLAAGAGAVHRFARTPSGWRYAGVLGPAALAPDISFGTSLDTTAGLLAVGAPGVASLGAVYVFRQEGGDWIEVQELTPPAASFGPKFGRWVSLEDDRLALGCPEEHVNRGCALLYRRGPGGFAFEARYSWPESVPTPWALGRRVELSQGQLFTSAPPLQQPGSSNNVGAVYFGNYADELRPYCFCDEAVPCSNAIATTGCRYDQSEPGAQLGGSGSTSVSADDLALGLTGLPASTEVVAFMSSVASGPAPLGDGLRCVGAEGVPVFRYAPVTTDELGMAELGPGIVGLAAARFPTEGQVRPGDTWYFQGWFRTPQGACGSGSNLTSALAVDFVP